MFPGPHPLLRPRSLARLRIAAPALATVLLGSAWTAAAIAGQGAELAPVLVEAEDAPPPGRAVTRRFEVADDSTGFAESIDLRSIWRGTEDVAEILDRSTSVRVRSQGGREHRSTLSIRGARAGQVRVLLDGVPLGRADDPVVDLATLPPSLIERIDLYRGFTPLTYASGGGASLVNVVTRAPEDAEVGGAVGFGSFGTARANVHLASPSGGGTLGAFLAWRRTDGDYDFADNNGTPENPFDDRVRTRENNDTQSVDASATWNRPLASGRRLVLREVLLHREEGVPGLAPFEFEDVSLRTVRSVTSLALQGEEWTLGGSLVFLDKDLDAGTSEPSVASNNNRSWTADLSAQWHRTVGKAHFLEGSLEAAHEAFRSRFDDSTGSADRDEERDSLAIAVSDEIALDAWNLLISLQLRHQRLWNRFEGDPLSPQEEDLPPANASSTDPRFGLRWNPLAWLALKSNASTWFRPPTLSEQFGADGFAMGNPELRPEDGRSFDVGADLSVERGPWRLALEYAWFANDTDDMIVVVLNSFRIPEARNLESGRIRGHEFALAAELPHGISISGNYTRQDTRNTSSDAPPSERGKRLPGVAGEEFSTRVLLRRPTWQLAWETQFTGRHFSDSENSPPGEIPSRLQHDLSLVLGPWRDWQLAIELENLTDTLVPDDLGSPLPGRAVHATLSWSGSPGEAH